MAAIGTHVPCNLKYPPPTHTHQVFHFSTIPEKDSTAQSLHLSYSSPMHGVNPCHYYCMPWCGASGPGMRKWLVFLSSFILAQQGSELCTLGAKDDHVPQRFWSSSVMAETHPKTILICNKLRQNFHQLSIGVIHLLIVLSEGRKDSVKI